MIVLQVLKTSDLHKNISPRVVDLSFIVTRAHQQIKALFCRLNFNYATNFVKKCFVFLSILLLLSIKKSPFEAKEVFCVPKNFVLFANHKQPLKFV